MPTLQDLKPFQLKSIEWLAVAGKAILGHPVGSGKSVIAMQAVLKRSALPCLVVSTATMKWLWRDEILKWHPDWGDKVAVVEDGKKAIPPGQKFVVCNYELLAKRGAELQKYGFLGVIGDEAARLKEEDSTRSRAFRILSTGVDTIFLLTATPLRNRPRELIHPLTLLGRMQQFGGKRKYQIEYCDAKDIVYGGRWVPQEGGGYKKVGGRHVWDDKGPDLTGPDGPKWEAKLEELRERLTTETDLWHPKPVMLRYRKADILPELPPEANVVVPVDLDKKIAGDYKDAKKDFAGWWKEKAQTAGEAAFAEGDDDALAKALVDVGDTPNPGVQAIRLRQLVGDGKVKPALAWIEEFLEDSGEKLVVFAHHVAVQKALIEGVQSLKVGMAAITSDMPSDWRALAAKNFQNDPNCKVIVCSLEAASEGITLTAASTCLFVEQSYVPAVNIQAAGRINRIGQAAAKTVSYVLVAKGTIDEKVQIRLAEKQKVLDAAVGEA